MKHVYIAEKPSVAKAFAQALGIKGAGRDGYLESDEAIVTWCVGHLVTMSYPEVYDISLKKWSLAPLPFIPQTYLYEVIEPVQKQFRIVSSILNRKDVDVIYVCTDAGREGEYIYRLVEMQAGVTGKSRKRVWIDSQTDEEIRRGIASAKDLSEYDNLSAAAYLRAKEDYLMGINFSRALSLRYAFSIKNYLHLDKCVIAVGRVMTCVLGIVVDREREIRNFSKTPYYGLEVDFLSPPSKVATEKEGASPDTQESSSQEADMALDKGAEKALSPDIEKASDQNTVQDAETGGEMKPLTLTAQWKSMPGSRYEGSPLLYNEKGFKEEKTAKELESAVRAGESVVFKVEKKTEKKQAPLLYNLAELQNDCSRFFKISPDQTLNVAQELYEKKLTTYPRTDARVLSSAVAKVITTNIKGLTAVEPIAVFAKSVLQHKSHEGISKTRYVNDKAITDHYAIIPTGQGLGALSSLSPLSRSVYECICRRFLAIFFPPAVFEKLGLTVEVKTDAGSDNLYNEYFISNYRLLTQKGYLHVLEKMTRKNMATQDSKDDTDTSNDQGAVVDEQMMAKLKTLRKGMKLQLTDTRIKESETSPPKRYNSGSLILTMENAGQFIEDDDLREQIKGMGIGTSATRAETLKKLVTNGYLQLNSKTQIVTPTQLGEMIFETVLLSMQSMLSPELTASWEKGLAGVADGSISEQEYIDKLYTFIGKLVNNVKTKDLRNLLIPRFNLIAPFYANTKKTASGGGTGRATKKGTKSESAKTGVRTKKATKT